jgi:hypothetical protein
LLLSGAETAKSLVRTKRTGKKSRPTHRLVRAGGDALAAYWLASGPADSAHHRCRSGWFLVSIQSEIPLFAEFLAGFYDRRVCNPGADGEASLSTAAMPSRATPMRKDGLGGTRLLRLEREAPPHGLRVEWGRCTDLVSPTPTKTTEEGRWCVAAESTRILTRISTLVMGRSLLFAHMSMRPNP